MRRERIDIIETMKRIAQILVEQNPKRFASYKKEFKRFQQLSERSDRDFSINWSDRYPMLNDKTKFTSFDRHYMFHTCWAARKVAQIKPKRHVDISSSLYFSGLVSAFIPVDFYDYRPAKRGLSDLTENRADLNKLPFKDDTVPCLSCMHTIEHVGLGRYGDKLDPDGDLKGIAELKRVVSVGGNLLFVVPVGKPKIMFNAHRIYSYDQILSYFKGFELVEYALIPDSEKDGGLVVNASKALTDKQTYACGCFWFRKE